MPEMLIKGRDGFLIARITNEQNGYQRIYDRTGRYLGYYNPYADNTYNRSGAFFTKGNALPALLNC